MPAMKRRLLLCLTPSVGPIDLPGTTSGIRTWRIRAKALKVLGVHADSRPCRGVSGRERSNRTGQVAAVNAAQNTDASAAVSKWRATR
jgi:hypothetical protein